MNFLDIWGSRAASVTLYAALLMSFAIPLSVCLKIGRFLNFHLASAYLVGAYSAYLLGAVKTGLPLATHLSLSIGVSLGLGAITSWILWQANEAIGFDTLSPDIHLVLSFFFYLAMQAGAAAIFGPRTLLAMVGTGASIVISQWARLLLLVLIAGMPLGLWLLRGTPYGLKWRAIADNPRLALDQGLQVAAVRRRTATLCGATAALAGALQAHDTGIQPYGNIILNATFAALLGGAFSPAAAIVGCFLLALFRQSAFAIDAYRWEDLIISCAILLFLACRPLGLFPHSGRFGDELKG
jgi:branched-subunit amino acid ABC-type transport system permease component